MLRGPTSEDLNEIINTSERTALMKNRVETNQWGLVYLLIAGFTQKWYHNVGIKPLGLTRSSRLLRMAGFLCLNLMQTTILTNYLVLSPLLSAQDVNLSREIYFQRARQHFGNPQMYSAIQELYQAHFNRPIDIIKYPTPALP